MQICHITAKNVTRGGAQHQGAGSDPDRYSILYTHLQTIRYDTIQFIILSNRYDTILYEYDPNLRAKHYFRLKCFRLSEAHWPHGTLRIILPHFFRLNMILHIVRILPPQKLCNNSPRRTFSSPPESNFGHRGPSELTRARRRYSSSGPRRYRVHPDTPPPHRYRIGSVAFAAATRIVSELSIGIEYSPDPIRPLDRPLLGHCKNASGDLIRQTAGLAENTCNRTDI